MSEDNKDGKPSGFSGLGLSEDCPLCRVMGIITPTDEAVTYGVVLRDVVPMEQLAPIFCENHQEMMIKYYTMMTDAAIDLMKKELSAQGIQDPGLEKMVEDLAESLLEPIKSNKDMN